MTTAEPIVDLRVFKARSFAVGVFLMTVVGFVLYGSMVLLPIMLQTLLGYPPMQAGIAMAPRGIGAFFMMPLTGLMIGRFDPRKLLTTGLIVGGGTLLLMSRLNLHAGYWDVFWPQLLQGIGMSLLFVPLTTVAMDPIPRERMGNATSLFNLMRNLGGSIGIAVTGTLLARHQQGLTSLYGSRVNAYDPAAQAAFTSMRSALIAGGTDPATATTRAYAGTLRHRPARGRDGVVRRTVSAAGRAVPPARPAGADHEAAARKKQPRRGALSNLQFTIYNSQ